MKHYSKLLLFALVAGTFVACADEEIATFQTEKPESMVKYEYLNAYDALKSYVDRSANPNFKLGSGITESDFISKGLVYSLACANYDELTPGNSMKYSSVVKDNGSMDFSTVTKFVDAAKGAGLSIYGHTLCWHAQQNLKYLNGLIADKVIPSEPGAVEEVQDALVDYSQLSSFPYWSGGPVTPGVKDGVLTVTNTVKQPNFYDVQFHIANNIPTIKGGTHKVTLLVKGTTAGLITLCLGDWGGQVTKKILIPEEWEEVSVELENVPMANSFVMLQSGDYVGTYQIKWVKVTHTKEVSGSVTTNEYDFQNDFENGAGDWNNWGGSSSHSVVDKGYNNSKCYEVNNPTAGSASYAVQIACGLPNGILDKEIYYLTLKIKGSVEGNIGGGFQNNKNYNESCGDFPSISITKEWKEITVSTTAKSANITNLIFNIGNYVGTIWIDDAALYRKVEGNTIPLTPEEKKEALTNALENWIKGMMEACDGYVKVWDAVNEPMSDGNTSELKYSTNVSADDAKNNFYWQDYLGKDYARDVVKFARQYGGEGMKLFINDYNLEAAYNSNKKCEGLIKMIEYWESDGVTKIDGIGTQMHVTYSMNPETQKKNEAAVVNMLNLLKATGKLIKISELDMGIADANGTNLKTAVVTFEQQKLMSDYYKFIVNKYFEIIPVAQRYGITHWSPSDSPDTDNSFWRKGEPIGLWDVNYNRKPAYAGYAEGLTGK